MNVLLDAPALRRHDSDGSNDLLAALAAERLARLHYNAASIAEHRLAPSNGWTWTIPRSIVRKIARRVPLIYEADRDQRKTKRPPGNWAASSSRENSSNGGFRFRQNFLPKSYE